MKVALIPCATTEWRDEGRLLGRVELPPDRRNEEQCIHWAEQLRTLELKQIFHAPDELATRMAALVGRKLVIPTKPNDDLAEVDVGLWAGLTEAQLKSRYASAYRQLCESPLNVNPPGGESLGAANTRLRAFLKKQIKRNGRTALGLVLRPVSLAMAWCALDHHQPAEIWEKAKQTTQPIILELTTDAAMPADV